MKKLLLILMMMPTSLLGGQQEVADSLKAIDREIVRFRWFATAGALGFMNVDGTLPDGGTGVKFNITSSGSANQDQIGVNIRLNNGYSGTTNPSFGLFLNNADNATNNIGAYFESGAGTNRVAVYAGYGNTPAAIQNGGALYYADLAGVVKPIFVGADGTTIRFTLARLGDIEFGNVLGQATTLPHHITGELGSGADKAGGDITIHSGIGTGSGAVSSFQILTPEAHGSDSVAQTEITSFSRSQKSYSMGDNSVVSLFTVVLPTNDTGCSTHISFSYQAAGGGNVVSHAGIALFAFTNNAATVTGSVTDSGEVIDGTGCGPGCDTWSVTASGTTATAKVKFDNTLGVTGALRYSLVYNTCQSWTKL